MNNQTRIHINIPRCPTRTEHRQLNYYLIDWCTANPHTHSMPMEHNVGRIAPNIVSLVHMLSNNGSRTEHAPLGAYSNCTYNDNWMLDLNWEFNRCLQHNRFETNHCRKIRSLQLLITKLQLIIDAWWVRRLSVTSRIYFLDNGSVDTGRNRDSDVSCPSDDRTDCRSCSARCLKRNYSNKNYFEL